MARLSCGVQCTSAALFAINIVFCLLGLTVVSFGIYVKINDNFKTVAELYSISEALGDGGFQWVSSGMIAGGVLTACLATFGCLGALAHKRMLLYLYAVLLGLIIIVEFAALITTLVYRNDLWKTYDSGFMDLFQHSYGRNRTDAIKIIEDMEKEFKCCGVNGFTDYIAHGWPIPSSCYPNPQVPVLPYHEGCAYAVVDWLWDKLPIIAGLLGTVLFIELFGLIASLVLGVALTHSTQNKPYDKF